jgi:hypothetical protein
VTLVRSAILVLLGSCVGGACVGPSADSEASREAREAMLFTVASQFHESASALEVTRFERVAWRDSCLEIRRRGDCQREPTAGYRLRLRRRGQTYEYRAPLSSPTDVALAAAPDPRIGRPTLEWMWSPSHGACQTLVISADARPAIGWCDGPLAELTWLPELPSREEWLYLRRRFAPFQVRDGDHMLVFNGAGTEVPSADWQRALESWASLRWSELRTGRSGAAHGRAAAFRRPIANRSGYCEILEVTEYGRAYAGRALCEGGGGEPGRTGWLSNELWEQFSSWHRKWSSYSDEPTGVHFFGRGTHAPTASDVRLLSDWARRAIAEVRRIGQ